MTQFRIDGVMMIDGVTYITDGITGVRTKEVLELPAVSDKEIRERMEKKLAMLFDVDEKTADTEITALLPDAKQLQANITAYNKTQKHKIPCFYRFGEHLPLVDAKYLLNIVQALPNSKCYINSGDAQISRILFRSDSTQAFLCPIRINESDATTGALTPTPEQQAQYTKESKIKYSLLTDESLQEISSADTSINAKNLPALFGKVEFEPNTVNLDIGGGRFDNVTDYLRQQGVTNYIYDPYNRSKEHNENAAKNTENHRSDSVTISNVLNVIAEKEARRELLYNAVDALKPGRPVYITVYEGDGSGIGKKTSKGYQLNKKTSEYLEELREVFPDAKMKNGVIRATLNDEVYLTESAKEWYSKDARFTKWEHKDLAFISAASWAGVNIPAEKLMQIPKIALAQARTDASTTGDRTSLSDHPIGSDEVLDAQREAWKNKLLDSEHGSAVFENGKIKKIDGKEQFTGAVRQERIACIVIGRPAAGKSRVFANPLSNANKARIPDSDTVKEWLDGFDEGYGAGYVQPESAMIANDALYVAMKAGDNLIIPRIGGSSILRLAQDLKNADYAIQLYYNEVSEETSVMRAMSRYAQEGRYLDIKYLQSIDGKPSDFFMKYAERSDLFKYAEWKNNDVGLGEEPLLRWSSAQDRPVGAVLRDQDAAGRYGTRDGSSSRTIDGESDKSEPGSNEGTVGKKASQQGAFLVGKAKDETRYSRLDEILQTNREYMDAVESRDMDAVRKMVEGQAELEFSKSKIRTSDGSLQIVYHGTDAQFTVFDRTKSRASMDIQGNFFSPWKLDAKGYGSNVRAFYLNIINPSDEGTAYKALNNLKGKTMPASRQENC